MTVTVHLLGGLGNNLFQYALGRTISEKTGSKLQCIRSEDIPYFGGKKFGGLEIHSNGFRSAALSIDGSGSRRSALKYDIFKSEDWDSHSIDLNTALSGRFDVSLRGLFQKSEYYEPYIEKIRGWIKVSNPLIYTSNLDKSIVVSVRAGRDYRALGWLVPKTFYDEAVKLLPAPENIYVCSDIPLGPEWDSIGGVVTQRINGDILSQLHIMASARHLICANSTFSWWAAALSNAENIIAPKPRGAGIMNFSGFGNSDLRLRRRSYREIECDEQEENPVFPVNRKVVSKVYCDGPSNPLFHSGYNKSWSTVLSVWANRLHQQDVISLKDIRTVIEPDNIINVVGLLLKTKMIGEAG